jgi:orotidine-5'-phosphate decarboxylase
VTGISRLPAGVTTAPKVLVALDFSSSSNTLQFVDQMSPDDCGLKVGKELFTTAGPELVRELVKRKFCVFLDLKFHDIPNTVAGAVAAAADMGVWMINVHASGGQKMMEAASRALESFGTGRPLITAVTVLTSLSEADLPSIGINRSLTDHVALLAALAAEAGMDGVVCSAQEASMLRRQQGAHFVLVTPGIRLQASASATIRADDQTRVVTPVQAMQMGANYLVVGRPITQANNPVAVLRTINEDISYIK